MSKTNILLVFTAVLALTGCQSPAQMLSQEQGEAIDVAVRRARFEMACQQARCFRAICSNPSCGAAWSAPSTPSAWKAAASARLTYPSARSVR